MTDDLHVVGKHLIAIHVVEVEMGVDDVADRFVRDGL